MLKYFLLLMLALLCIPVNAQYAGFPASYSAGVLMGGFFGGTSFLNRGPAAGIEAELKVHQQRSWMINATISFTRKQNEYYRGKAFYLPAVNVNHRWYTNHKRNTIFLETGIGIYNYREDPESTEKYFGGINFGVGYMYPVMRKADLIFKGKGHITGSPAHNSVGFIIYSELQAGMRLRF